MLESVVVAVWLAGNSSAVHPPAITHVRSDESRIRDLIADGYVRSATFKALVDAVEDLRCIVYVASVVKLSQGMSGALLHQSAGLRETPILRVLVKANLSRAEAIATIGHELQHVVEAVSARRAVGEEGIRTVFDALDPEAGPSGDTKYETDAAVAIATKIRHELR